MKKEMTMKEIKAELKAQGLSIEPSGGTFNGQKMYRVWNDREMSEQNAPKYTKGGIIEEFIR